MDTNRSPQWAKNAANRAYKRAIRRSMPTVETVFKPTGRTEGEMQAITRIKNMEGREYKSYGGPDWEKGLEQISGPQMPSAYLPESGYGASPRPYYTMVPPRNNGPMEGPVPAAPETRYGGKRRKTRRSRKTRRNSRK